MLDWVTSANLDCGGSPPFPSTPLFHPSLLPSPPLLRPPPPLPSRPLSCSPTPFPFAVPKPRRQNHKWWGPQSFLEASPDQIQTVVATNLVGSLLCTRVALRRMAGQARGGHIFMMDGAGSDGLPTPQYAAYGATKAGISHLMRSLQVFDPAPSLL